MKQTLTDRQKVILNEIFQGQDASRWIASIQSESLSFDEIEQVCELLSREFHMKGIDEDFEANVYGKEIEAIIDIVNRPRLR